MRIELPPVSWADPAQRADDDAHTLTVASPQAAPDWVKWHWPSDPALSVRTQVAATAPVTVTLTF